jgi:hypothetical protein
MSNLGKIFLYLALVGAIAALVGGGLIINQRWADAATLLQTKQAQAAAEQANKKAQAEKDADDAAKLDDDSKLTAANAKIDDLNTQLKTVQQQATDASTALVTANDNLKTAQDALDAIKKTLGDRTADQIVADEAKAQSDLTAAQSEQKILQDQYQDSLQKIADLNDAINRSHNGGQMPGVSGKVTFVDNTWNFVVLDVGLANGVVPNGELIVYRGRSFLGKVKVTKVDPNDAVAEILPDTKGVIQIGDSVLN